VGGKGDRKLAPIRNIPGAATSFDDPDDLVVVEAWMYVANADGPRILISPTELTVTSRRRRRCSGRNRR